MLKRGILYEALSLAYTIFVTWLILGDMYMSIALQAIVYACKLPLYWGFHWLAERKRSLDGK